MLSIVTSIRSPITVIGVGPFHSGVYGLSEQLCATVRSSLMVNVGTTELGGINPMR
jgi:hypothetical protein